MKIFTVNFEHLIKNYTLYQNSLKELELGKEKFTNKVDEIRKEMEMIVSSSRLLVLDESLKNQNSMKLRELQSEGLKLESEFRSMISQRQNEILEKSFSEIAEIAKDWSIKNGADLVLNINAIIFSKNEHDVTQKIIDILREKDLYSETT